MFGEVRRARCRGVVGQALGLQCLHVFGYLGRGALPGVLAPVSVADDPVLRVPVAQWSSLGVGRHSRDLLRIGLGVAHECVGWGKRSDAHPNFLTLQCIPRLFFAPLDALLAGNAGMVGNASFAPPYICRVAAMAQRDASQAVMAVARAPCSVRVAHA